MTLFSPPAGPMFFLSCFSFVVGIAVLYYYGGESWHKKSDTDLRLTLITLIMFNISKHTLHTHKTQFFCSSL